MKKIISRAMLSILLITLLTACTGQEGSAQQGYKETKTMVVDILKTEEAQKAIEEAKKKKEEEEGGKEKIMQMLSSPQGQQIQMAVKNILTDPGYTKQLETLMTDPKFAGEFAKAVQKENEQIHKDLMKDPEYQTLLLDVMKSGDFEKMVIEILKGKEYRKQTMTILQESLENPIFKMEMLELMKKAVEEQSKPKKESGGGGGGGGGGGS